MTTAQIKELIRIREQERSAVRRRMKEARGGKLYQQAEARLAEIERELSRLNYELRKAQGAALTRGARL